MQMTIVQEVKTTIGKNDGIARSTPSGNGLHHLIVGLYFRFNIGKKRHFFRFLGTSAQNTAG
jgi:hypothetical protein